MTREGLLTYDSIIEESIARVWECMLDNRVCVFKELCEDGGPDCQIAKEGLFVEHKEHGKMHFPSRFNEQLLRCVATGMIVDRTFAVPDKNYQKRPNESKQCVKYLDKWLKKYSRKARKIQISKYRQGGGLQEPTKGVSAKSYHGNQIGNCTQIFTQLMIPTEGIMRGVPGYGLMHPNTINAAVLQRYGVVRPDCSFDAVSLAPNFDLLLNTGKRNRSLK